MVEPGNCKSASLSGDGLWLVTRHFGKNVSANEKVPCGFFLCGQGVAEGLLYCFRRDAASVLARMHVSPAYVGTSGPTIL
jgi:hypothetical protein